MQNMQLFANVKHAKNIFEMCTNLHVAYKCTKLCESARNTDACRSPSPHAPSKWKPGARLRRFTAPGFHLEGAYGLGDLQASVFRAVH